MELLQVLVCVLFAILRTVLKIGPNNAGMDVNVALFGLGLILMGLSVSDQMIVRGLIILAAVAVSLREKAR